MRRMGIALVLAALALPGCSESSESASTEDGAAPAPKVGTDMPRRPKPAAPHPATHPVTAKPTHRQPPPGLHGFTGKYKDRYEEDHIICKITPIKQIAVEFELPASADPVAVAEAYADGFYGRFEQAAFEGCLNALLGRP